MLNWKSRNRRMSDAVMYMRKSLIRTTHELIPWRMSDFFEVSQFKTSKNIHHWFSKWQNGILYTVFDEALVRYAFKNMARNGIILMIQTSEFELLYYQKDIGGLVHIYLDNHEIAVYKPTGEIINLDNQIIGQIRQADAFFDIETIDKTSVVIMKSILKDKLKRRIIQTLKYSPHNKDFVVVILVFLVLFYADFSID